ncbi:MAG: hypothetical protein IJH63_09480 [Methanobrevibacter sp.]|nr:hypothetical protein [Methanobrevibacter sp.]
MKQSTKVYLLIFIIIAVMAFVLSSVFANVVVIDNTNTKKLTAIEDDGFEPHDIKNVEVIVPKVQNTTQNTTTLKNITDDIIEVADNTWNEIIG